MFKLLKHRIDLDKYAKREISSAELIPYLCHWNHNTILTKRKELMRVIKVGGFSFETADDEDVDIRKTIRNLLFKGMASGNFSLYFHIVRSRQNLVSSIFAKQDFPSTFASQLAEAWRKKHSSKQGFV